MNKRSFRRPAVVATAAVAVLALGLGGTAVADGLIKSNDIAKDTIKSRHLGDDAVKGQHVKNGSLSVDDLSPAAVKLIQDGVLTIEAINAIREGLLTVEAFEEIQAGNVTEDDLADAIADFLTEDEIDAIVDGLVTKADFNELKDSALTDDDIAAIQDGVFVGENWGVNLRNTQGTANAMLRQGPFTTNFGRSTEPPLGGGSLQLQSTGTSSKVDFSNEVLYTDQNLVEALDGNVAFSTTETNASKLPTIRIEVSANLAGVANYSTLAFVPQGAGTDDGAGWHRYNQSDGGWFATRAAGTATGCLQTDLCTFDELMAALPDATIHGVAVGSNGSNGPDVLQAVDALRIGDTVFDFEARGVFAKDAS